MNAWDLLSVMGEIPERFLLEAGLGALEAGASAASADEKAKQTESTETVQSVVNPASVVSAVGKATRPLRSIVIGSVATAATVAVTAVGGTMIYKAVKNSDSDSDQPAVTESMAPSTQHPLLHLIQTLHNRNVNNTHTLLHLT